MLRLARAAWPRWPPWRKIGLVQRVFERRMASWGIRREFGGGGAGGARGFFLNGEGPLGLFACRSESRCHTCCERPCVVARCHSMYGHPPRLYRAGIRGNWPIGRIRARGGARPQARRKPAASPQARKPAASPQARKPASRRSSSGARPQVGRSSSGARPQVGRSSAARAAQAAPS